MVVSFYYGILHAAFILCLYLIFIWGIEDLLVDIFYWTRQIYRRLFVYTKYPRLTVEDLYKKEEQWIAIMVPAWQEAGVIGKMLETTIKHLDYDRYVIFCGTYVNDPETSREVDLISEKCQKVVKATVAHPGPTNKADCLNFVVREIHSYEVQHGISFSGYVLHDSEDIVHPLELKLFNYLLPRKDMIQIPVTALERSWKDFVACTYMDEFSEWHLKDLLVRERLTKAIPSAGVGTCFSRRAISFLEQKNGGSPFPTDSLTEDYVVGLTLAEAGMGGIILHFPIAFRGKKGIRRTRKLYVSVAEYFPDTFWAAVRQKSRWILGIALQDRCDGCGQCEKHCPHDAVRLKDDRPSLDDKRCKGCAYYCTAACPVGAVVIDGRSARRFQRRVVDSALAVTGALQGKVYYVNILMDVCPYPDCYPFSDVPFVSDRGILMSHDPVALDSATLNVLDESSGIRGSIAEESESLGSSDDKLLRITGVDPTSMIAYAKKLGMGSDSFEIRKA